MIRKKKTPTKNFESAIAYFKAHSFDVQEMPEPANRIQVRKYGCAAVLFRGADGGVVYGARPGYLLGGEIATLTDRGFQKFLVTPRMTVAATADRLRALHRFQEEVMEAAGKPDLYNLSLGTVSNVYRYDRVKGRDSEPAAAPDLH